MWAPQVAEDAKACVDCLENMLEHLMPLCAVSSKDPLVVLHPHTADYKLSVMLPGAMLWQWEGCHMGHCLPMHK